MNERITLISILDEENDAKITKYTSKISSKICKVPYGKGVIDREKVDTLPYHFTLYTFDIKKEYEVMEYLKTKSFPKLKVWVDKIEIINGKEDSYVLVFSIKGNDSLKRIQEDIYSNYPNDYYHPDHFRFHITITISKDKQMIESTKRMLEEEFVPFELEISKFGLFEIYPAKLVEYYE